jgi:hypothetical protein
MAERQILPPHNNIFSRKGSAPNLQHPGQLPTPRIGQSLLFEYRHHVAAGPGGLRIHASGVCDTVAAAFAGSVFIPWRGAHSRGLPKQARRAIYRRTPHRHDRGRRGPHGAHPSGNHHLETGTPSDLSAQLAVIQCASAFMVAMSINGWSFGLPGFAPPTRSSRLGLA